MNEPEYAGGAGADEEGGEGDGHRHLYGHPDQGAGRRGFRLFWVFVLLYGNRDRRVLRRDEKISMWKRN